ncbi:Hypothetical protein R9X50_00079200 [Acrodontium crateriforme]|uniref:Transcription factor domain-containing protein n=1 Tax=Acrodontium crateriforme TaxID=150365 RepID=A0AAQ3LXY9_9PEZI|nr:Hypothetical protein R9X50_00079200 [Acrodontium crateriforme]
MTVHFPFVVIPDGDVATVQQTKPFLLQTAILASMNRDVDGSLRLEESIMRHLSEEVFFNSARSLDLLQGLLVYIAWYHFRFFIGRKMTIMLQLAISIAADLGLTRPPKATDMIELQIKTGSSDAEEAKSRTLEERRAYMGCYYLSSIVEGGFHRRIDPMRSTPHLDTCLRLQQFRARMAASLGSDIPSLSLDYSQETGKSIKSLQADLANLRRTAPLFGAPQAACNMHHLDLEIQLYEIAFTPSDPKEASKSQRLAFLRNCLSSVKAVFGIWFSLQVSEFFDFSYPTQIHLGHAIIILCRLSTLNTPGWDLEETRAIIDFAGVIDDLQASLERLKFQFGDELSDRHIFVRTVKPLQMFKFLNSKGAVDGGASAGEENGNSSFGDIAMDGMFDGFDMRSWDEMFPPDNSFDLGTM